MTFKPQLRKKIVKRHILVALTEHEYVLVKEMAAKCGVSIREIARQGMLYALNNMDRKP